MRVKWDQPQVLSISFLIGFDPTRGLSHCLNDNEQLSWQSGLGRRCFQYRCLGPFRINDRLRNWALGWHWVPQNYYFDWLVRSQIQARNIKKYFSLLQIIFRKKKSGQNDSSNFKSETWTAKSYYVWTYTFSPFLIFWDNYITGKFRNAINDCVLNCARRTRNEIQTGEVEKCTVSQSITMYPSPVDFACIFATLYFRKHLLNVSLP